MNRMLIRGALMSEGTEVVAPLSDAVIQTMIRYELGDFDPKVRERLALIFKLDPPDAIDRLERAAAYLGIRGLTQQTLGRLNHAIEKNMRLPLQAENNPLMAA